MQARWLVLAIVGSNAASAEPAEPGEPGGPGESGELSIWYRSSNRCPTGEVFLERLSRLGHHGRLARGGDRVDFVVTLDSTESGSFGRLERQAERGTIAIREVQAPKCEEVAEALALSLDLTLGPMHAPDTAVSPPPPAPVAAAPVAAAPVATPPQSSSVAKVEDRSLPEATTPSDGATEEAAAVGVQALLLTGIAPDPMFGGAAFGELVLPFGMSARLSGYAAWAASTVEGAELEHQLFSARLEGCSPRLRLSDLGLAGCVGVDAGLVRGTYSGPTGSSDSGPWGAATLLGRAGWRVSGAWTVELQAGVMLPWVRYETGDPEGAALASGDAVLVTAGLGVSYVFGGSKLAESAGSQVSSTQTAGR